MTAVSSENINICRFCKISLPCGCQLLIGKGTLLAPIQDCNKALSEIVAVHTINYALITEFNFPRKKFDSNSFHNSPIQLGLPNISLDLYKFNDLTEQDRKLGLDLKQVSQKIASSNTTFYSKPTEYESSLYFLPWDDSDQSRGIILFICFLIVILGTITYFILFYKVFRKLAILAAQVKTITAESDINPVILHTDEDKPTDTISDNQPVFILDLPPYFYYCCFICIVVISIRILYKMFHINAFFSKVFQVTRTYFTGVDKGEQKIQLYMQLLKSGVCISFPLDNLPFAAGTIAIHDLPAICRMRLGNEWIGRKTLHVIWTKPLEYKAYGFKANLPLPTKIKIPLIFKKSITTVFSQDDARSTIITLLMRDLNTGIILKEFPIDFQPNKSSIKRFKDSIPIETTQRSDISVRMSELSEPSHIGLSITDVDVN